MTEKTVRHLALDAIDQAFTESIRQEFISMAPADPTDDGGAPMVLRRFKRWLPHVAHLHKQARVMATEAFKEETP